ncbi:MAG: tetratricopeptide repeat protein [Anaerolineae bacterium]|nr:tetratricopeptide repeat protein [Anaerolineae bacterium]
MSTPYNPYIAGNPVGNTSAFIGRTEVLREVLRVLRHPQDNAIVLYGQRRIGKTSILQYLETWLPEQGPYYPVKFNLQNKGNWSLSRVLQELAQTIALILNQAPPDLGDKPEIAFRKTWLPSLLENLPREHSLILLFDEFDVLNDPQDNEAVTTFFPYLQDLLDDIAKKLQFVFVVGRNIDDLHTVVRSLFKGAQAQRVSVLNYQEVVDLIRLSELNKTLHWEPDAIERIWELTGGHPFLTQLLCSRIWGQLYVQNPVTFPTATLADVEAMVSATLDASRNAMEWLWEGLPAAERVVISALANAGPRAITKDELDLLLHESGVRILIQELQNAPQLLQDWDLIDEPDNSGYRFRVELMRQWLTIYRPLSRVQEELDRIEPAAEKLYQAALDLYHGGKLEDAISPLRQAIGVNPNHVGANQLLAEILLAQGEAIEACNILDELYQYQPSVTRPRLVQALLAKAQLITDKEEQQTLYERVIELETKQPEALAKLAQIKKELRRRKLEFQLKEIERLKQAKQYQRALELVQTLSQEYPEDRDWRPDQQTLARQVALFDLYQRALGALESGDRDTAQSLLAQIIAQDPTYEEVTRYLHLAVTGVDVIEVQNELKLERERSLTNVTNYVQKTPRRQDRITTVPTVVIGLGGTGLKIATFVKKNLLEIKC